MQAKQGWRRDYRCEKDYNSFSLRICSALDEIEDAQKKARTQKIVSVHIVRWNSLLA